MQTVSHVKITTAALVSLVTTLVGSLCAILPPLAPDKRTIIAALTGVIVTSSLVANAVHALASSKLSASVLEKDLEAAAQKALSRFLAAVSEPKAPEPAPAPVPAPAPAPPVALVPPPPPA